MPGKKPCFQVFPAFVLVAQPISELPPSKKRPDWNVATIVEPKAYVSGSTWVLCWLVLLVKGSLLSCTSLVRASAEANAGSERATSRQRVQANEVNTLVCHLFRERRAMVVPPQRTWRHKR